MDEAADDWETLEAEDIIKKVEALAASHPKVAWLFLIIRPYIDSSSPFFYPDFSKDTATTEQQIPVTNDEKEEGVLSTPSRRVVLDGIVVFFDPEIIAVLLITNQLAVVVDLEKQEGQPNTRNSFPTIAGTVISIRFGDKCFFLNLLIEKNSYMFVDLCLFSRLQSTTIL